MKNFVKNKQRRHYRTWFFHFADFLFCTTPSLLGYIFESIVSAAPWEVACSWPFFTLCGYIKCVWYGWGLCWSANPMLYNKLRYLRKYVRCIMTERGAYVFFTFDLIFCTGYICTSCFPIFTCVVTKMLCNKRCIENIYNAKTGNNKAKILFYYMLILW